MIEPNAVNYIVVLAVRNSSLSDPFSKLGSPDFRPESLPIVVHNALDKVCVGLFQFKKIKNIAT